MPRATRVDASQDRTVADNLILGHEQRSAARSTATSVKGVTVEIDLNGPVRLRNGDLLALDDGTLVEVVAAAEPLIEARAATVSALARLAWHLGDRHIQAELLPNRIRARPDPAVEALLTSLGAKVIRIEAPFEPEGGAYASAPGHSRTHDHDHAHAHDHGHDRQHGDHGGHDHRPGRKHK
ncbi:MAG: urease accessory protein UreE [Pseudolabrys sp.]|nr:urease accessory protein UreE [Pseudolabrys sp.]